MTGSAYKFGFTLYAYFLFTRLQSDRCNLISAKQNILLTQLHAQGKRIEKLSKLEHDLIKEVHPQVGEIKAGMDTVVGVVKENAENDSLKTSSITQIM